MANEKPTELKTIRLFVGDTARLAAYYPKLGYNAVIRRLVSEHLKKLDAKFHESGVSDSIDLETHQ